LSAYGVDEVAIFLFSAYPGSQIFRELHAQGRVRPDDGYFFGLTSLNAKFNTLTPKTYNDHVPAIELAVYRTAFMMANYVVGYLCFPSRILRTLANVFGGGEGHQATTVLEHRIRDAFSRRKARRQARRASAG
jgi:hypothetical protein